MSRNQRIGLVVVAVVVAVVGFVIASPSDDEQDTGGTGGQPAQTEPDATDGQGPRRPPDRPRVERLTIRGGAPAGGLRSLTYKKGETVRLVVTSDAQDEIHLHGYDLTRNPAPGKPARFRFKAEIEGAFEIESHVAEDTGREPLVARLIVEP